MVANNNTLNRVQMELVKATEALKPKPVVTWVEGKVNVGGTDVVMQQRVVDGEAKPAFKTGRPLAKADVLAYAKANGVSRKQAERTLKAQRNAEAAPVVDKLVAAQAAQRKLATCNVAGTVNVAKGNLRITVTTSTLSKENQAAKDARDFASHAGDCLRLGLAKAAKGGIIIPLLS